MYYKCVHTCVWSVTPSRVDTLYHQCINNVSTCDLQPATWAEVIQCIIYVSTMYQHSRLEPATWAELIQCINNVSTCECGRWNRLRLIQCIIHVSTMYQHSRLEPATWAELIQCISHVSTMCPHVSVVCDTVSGWYIVSSMYQQCINMWPPTSNLDRGDTMYHLCINYVST